VDQAGRTQISQNRRGLAGLFRAVRGNAHVQGAPAANGKIECRHSFFEGCVRVWAMAVENIHIFQPHALETLVEAGNHLLS